MHPHDSNEVWFEHPTDDGIGLGTSQGVDMRDGLEIQRVEYADDILLLEQVAEEAGVQIEVVLEEQEPPNDFEGNGTMSSSDTRDCGTQVSIDTAELAESLPIHALDDGSNVVENVLGGESVGG